MEEGTSVSGYTEFNSLVDSFRKTRSCNKRSNSDSAIQDGARKLAPSGSSYKKCLILDNRDVNNVEEKGVSNEVVKSDGTSVSVYAELNSIIDSHKKTSSGNKRSNLDSAMEEGALKLAPIDSSDKPKTKRKLKDPLKYTDIYLESPSKVRFTRSKSRRHSDIENVIHTEEILSEIRKIKTPQKSENVNRTEIASIEHKYLPKNGKVSESVNEAYLELETSITTSNESKHDSLVHEGAHYNNRLVNIKMALFESDLTSILSATADVNVPTVEIQDRDLEPEGRSEHDSVVLRQFLGTDHPMSDLSGSDSDDDSLPDLNYFMTPRKNSIPVPTPTTADLEKPLTPVDTSLQCFDSKASWTSDPASVDAKPSLCMEKTGQKRKKRPKDELSKKGKERQKRIREKNEVVVKFLISAQMKRHLTKILLSKEPSTMHDEYRKATPRERSVLQQRGFGPLDEEDQIETVLNTYVDWVRKMGLEPTNYVNYFFAVWIPEAIVYYFRKKKSYSRPKALEMFNKGYRRTKEERQVLMASLRKTR